MDLNITVDSPYRNPIFSFLQRPGPLFAICLKRGTVYDVLHHFKSIEDAYRTLNRNKDIMTYMRTGRIALRAIDNAGNTIHLDKLIRMIYDKHAE